MSAVKSSAAPDKEQSVLGVYFLRVEEYVYINILDVPVPENGSLRREMLALHSLHLFQPGNNKNALSGYWRIVRSAFSGVTAPLPATTVR